MATQRRRTAMTDLVERVTDGIAYAFRYRQDAEAIAKAAIEAMGGERVWATYCEGNPVSMTRSEYLAASLGKRPEYTVVLAMLIPLGESDVAE
jgi:hypothetical protein